MNQQINLYQPIFRQERKLFSLRTVGMALAIVAVVLLGIWGFSIRNVAKLAREVESVQRQLEAQQRMAAKVGGQLSASTSPEAVQANVKRLSALLAERTRALELLRNGAAGSRDGFAARLSALARSHIDGLWLERLMIGPNENGSSGTAGGLLLEGRSTDAQLIPVYLQQLADQPELSGARFDEVIIDRHPNREAAEREALGKPPLPTGPSTQAKEDALAQSTVRFSVSSSSVRDLPPEPRS